MKLLLPCEHDLAFRHFITPDISYCCACLRVGLRRAEVCPECGCKDGTCDGFSFICQLARAEQMAMAAAFDLGMLQGAA